MGLTIDFLRGRLAVYMTCDNCGLPILDRVRVEPPNGARDYERHSHADRCPIDSVRAFEGSDEG